MDKINELFFHETWIGEHEMEQFFEFIGFEPKEWGTKELGSGKNWSSIKYGNEHATCKAYFDTGEAAWDKNMRGVLTKIVCEKK